MSDLDHLIATRPADDPQVSEALVSTYYSYVLRLAVSILNDPDEAEDAAQETFIQALLHLHRYEPGTRLKSWLSTITVNQCRDRLRRRKTRQALAGVLQGISRIFNVEASPEEAAIQNERSAQLWRAVQALDEKHRLPVILRFVHGYPVREIAQTLEISEGTVHSRLHYALRKLQNQAGGFMIVTEDDEPTFPEKGGVR